MTIGDVIGSILFAATAFAFAFAIGVVGYAIAVVG